jgi:ATP-dependent Clp endopeptidase proteolytic subunit ClpP
MKKVHFYLYGAIANEPGSFAQEFGIISAKQVADFIHANSGAEELVVHINSPGGDVHEGFAIHDILSTSGKKITTIIEGMCASIATIVALAGSTREMTEHSTFFIHNAFGGAMGDAEELQKYTNAVKEATDKIIDFYVSKTGAEREAISAMMSNETSMVAEEAKRLGFITDIKVPVTAKILSFTSIQKSNNNFITKEDMKKENQTLLASIKNLLGIKNEEVIVAMLDVETDKGTLHVEKPKVEGIISVDDVCTIDGAPATEGEYTTNDGTIYAIDASGKVTAVTIEEEENKDSEEVTALKASLKASEDALEAMKAEKESFENSMTIELTNIKKQITSNYTPPKDKKQFNKGAVLNEDPAVALRERKESYNKK